MRQGGVRQQRDRERLRVGHDVHESAQRQTGAVSELATRLWWAEVGWGGLACRCWMRCDMAGWAEEGHPWWAAAQGAVRAGEGEARLRVEVGQADQHLLGRCFQEGCARVVPQDRECPHRVGQRLLVELLHAEDTVSGPPQGNACEPSSTAQTLQQPAAAPGAVLWAGRPGQGRGGRSSTRMSTMPRAAAASSSWGSG